ncbi:hypothetical protein [Bradyrhizobium sp. BR 10261]|uniref:hypothetical protein n=1 Tax=Bradyrhizobium sp. BR 10261 TaxID=2749992 RepID=UPI001C653183|nr:hypothetical protein [Bradyrhizobium sp. BR 10261]MBW7967142.1 hypothetical protein [Bradyrhizobium sp. BR 10261]
MSEGRQALSDLFCDEAGSYVPSESLGGPMDQILLRLKSMPRQAATRHIGWRLVAAFAHDRTKDLVFWALLCARFQGWEGDADVFAEMRKMLSLPTGTIE